MGKRLGDDVDPLLVSVRSGAPFSMPGMMDTVLNLGLNDVSVGGLAKQTDNERFAYDSYRRFVQMFGKIVLDIDGERVRGGAHELARTRGRRDRPRARRPRTSRGLVETFKAIVKAESRHRLPAGPAGAAPVRDRSRVQVVERRARRASTGKMEKIPDDLGTAVNVQTMVFGNKGDDSGTGVAFTRNPATGENAALRRLPRATRRARTSSPASASPSRSTRWATSFPECHQQLLERDADAREPLPRHVRHRVHDRAGPALHPADPRRQAHRGGRAADGGRDGGRGADRQARGGAARAARRSSTSCCTRSSTRRRSTTALAKGLNASPGAAVGKVVLHRRRRRARTTRPARTVILVRPETSPDDLHGMIAAEGILTSRGGLVSHAAVVARGMGTPAVCGADGAQDRRRRRQAVHGRRHRRARGRRDLDQRHDRRGRARRGAPWSRPSRPASSTTILGWADEFRTHRRCAPTPTCPTTREVRATFGAEGIGLCRTEHMFLGDRLPIVQRFILADDDAEERRRARRARRSSSAPTSSGILEAMDGLPVTIRLLDPPLHEFLPDIEELLVQRRARASSTTRAACCSRRRSSGARPTRCSAPAACRLGILKPGLYRMQVQALLEAAVERKQRRRRPAASRS